MEENKLDVRKAFEALARIIGEREHIKITVLSVDKKEDTEDKTA